MHHPANSGLNTFLPDPHIQAIFRFCGGCGVGDFPLWGTKESQSKQNVVRVESWFNQLELSTAPQMKVNKTMINGRKSSSHFSSG